MRWSGIGRPRVGKRVEMIHYDLRCGDGHVFDGWFRSSAAFEQQAESGFLNCPVCASTVVTRAPMAPRVSRGASAPPVPMPSAKPAPAPPAQAAIPVAPPGSVQGTPAIPDRVRAILQRIRAQVEQTCDYVGPRFADEARAMQAGDLPHRPIFGEATPDQAEALVEDGIDITRIPWVPRADG